MIKRARFEVWRDDADQWRVKFVARNSKIVTWSESYRAKAGALNAVRVMRESAAAEIKIIE
jgi:uncharacterized protein YegP (UPF0339 family)